VSSYANLKLGPFIVASSRNCINPIIMSLFRENDKNVYHGCIKDLISKYSLNYDFSSYRDYEDDYNMTIMYYSSNTSTIKDRLELMGFTYDGAKKIFQRGIKDEINFLDNSGLALLKRESRILENLTFDVWIENLNLILSKKLPPISAYAQQHQRRISPVLRYILSRSDENYGFPGNDFRYFLRILCSIVPNSYSLTYDLTDLCLSGYISESDNLVKHAEILIQEDFPISNRIIILTEGVMLH
jgi:hypothetical protein